MRNRIERLRRWLLAGAGLLVLVLATFIGSARYVAHHFHVRLPAKMGLNIKSDCHGCTYSKTVGSRTIYMVRSEKQEEHADGTVTLYGVDMVLYGQTGDRANHISGEQFEYDQKVGLLRAIGLVHIDMQTSTAAQAGKAKAPIFSQGEDAGGRRILHATTSGLVYMDKLGVAATGESIEFQMGEMTGHAVGADYTTDTGVLMLHSAVTMTGMQGKRPVTLTAASAELDNREQRALLTKARYVSLGDSMEADQATLHTRPDGTLARIEAQGNVTGGGMGATIGSAHADVLLNAASQPVSAVLTGGVTYARDEPLRQTRGRADVSTIAFDTQAKPQPEHAVFSGAVHMTERTRASVAAKEPWSVRDLTAARVDASLVSPGDGNTQIRDAEATGNARLTMIDNGSLEKAGGARTELSADELKTHLTVSAEAKQPPHIDTVAGRGHTLLHQVSADGAEQTTSGETLDAKMRPPTLAARAPASVTRRVAGGVAASKVTPPSAASSGSDPGLKIADDLLSAVQQGHVAWMRRIPARSGTKAEGAVKKGEDVQRGTSDRASYDGDLDRVTLAGDVQIADAGSAMWANQITLDRKTHDALAEGAVKVNYVQDRSAKAGVSQTNAGEPAHVLADRVEMNHATDVATFHGKPARMWQGGSQVQAPVLEFARTQRKLVARGEPAGGDAGLPPVRTILVTGARDRTRSSKAGAKVEVAKDIAGSGTPQVVRIASRELVYSEALRQAEFTGSVRLESGDGTLTAHDATVYLLPTVNSGAPQREASTDNAAPEIALDGRIEHIVATGPIDLVQPGRHATGQRLVYTAKDEVYVLSGDDKAKATVADTARGTTSVAAAFRFHPKRSDGTGAADVDDERVEALSIAPGETAPGERVRTDTRVDPRKKPQ